MHTCLTARGREASGHVQARAALSIWAQTPNESWEPVAPALKTEGLSPLNHRCLAAKVPDLPEAERTPDKETQQDTCGHIRLRRCRAQTMGSLGASPAPPPALGLPASVFIWERGTMAAPTTS